MQHLRRFLSAILFVGLTSCGDSAYTTIPKVVAGQPEKKAPAAENVKSDDSKPVVVQTKAQPEGVLPPPKVVPAPPPSNDVCSLEAPSVIEASVPTHQDVDAGATNRYGGGMPTSDVAQSAVVRLDLSKIKGSVLPVSSFSLDDIAIIVRETDSLAAASTFEAASRHRKIYVPAHALMIYDGNNPQYASGSVDSQAATTYNILNKAVFLPGGQSRSLREVYDSGIPLIAHNNISISDLKSRGFVDVAGRVVFKIFHVAHGWGNVTLKFEIKKCTSVAFDSREISRIALR